MAGEVGWVRSPRVDCEIGMVGPCFVDWEK